MIKSQVCCSRHRRDQIRDSTSTTSGLTLSSTSSLLMMDVHSGSSTASDSSVAIYASCVASRSSGFQSFEVLPKLRRAVEDHILIHTGLVVRIGDVVGFLSDFVKTTANLRALVAVYCSGIGDDDLALRGSSPSSPVLGASASAPAAELSSAGEMFGFASDCVYAPASPSGRVSDGRDAPSGHPLGSLSDCSAASPGPPRLTFPQRAALQLGPDRP